MRTSIVLNPEQFIALKKEMVGQDGRESLERMMDPEVAEAQGVDLRNISVHLGALANIIGSEAVNAALATGEPVLVVVDWKSSTEGVKS